MIAIQPGQRALHALRLVLRDSYIPSPPFIRRFSVAVLPNYPQQTTSSSSSKAREREWGPRHVSSDYEGSSDFLEDPLEPEYSSASLVLPDRGHKATAHWANLFPSPSTTPSTPVRSRRCDTLARLVSFGDLVTARKVYDELSALHIGMLRRSLYLQAALSSLSQTTSAREAFLFWLELVPNRPAVRPNPEIKAIWGPVITRLLSDHSSDLDFIGNFLTLMARKGILPSVIGPFMRHLALFTSPQDLERRMEQLEKVYMRSTTSMHSTSSRARAHGIFARMRVEGMWNSFIRAVAAAGWEEEVVGLVTRLEGRMGISEYTRGYVLERQAPEREPKSDQTESNDSLATYTTVTPSGEPEATDSTVPRIIRRIRKARQGLVRPSEMSEITLLLTQHHRLNLIRLLGKKMERSSEKTREMWYHAQLIRARKGGKADREIVRLFEGWFHWVGLPGGVVGKAGRGVEGDRGDLEEEVDTIHSPTSRSAFETPDPSPNHRTKLYPSPALLTTLLPSLLGLLGTPSQVLSFHTAYLNLAPSLSPRLRPTPITHSVLLREITHLFGPSTGLLALRNMISAGLEPDLGAYNAVLWSLAGRGEFEDVRRLLRAMESGSGIGNGIGGGGAGREMIMPKPDEKTYKGIAGILDRLGMERKAGEIRGRIRSKGYKARNVQGSRERISREERRMGFVYGKKAREVGGVHKALGREEGVDLGEEEWEKEKVAVYG